MIVRIVLYIFANIVNIYHQNIKSKLHILHDNDKDHKTTNV